MIGGYDEAFVVKGFHEPEFRPILDEALERHHNNVADTHKKKEGYLSVSQIAGNMCMRKQYYIQKEAVANDRGFNPNQKLIFDFGHLWHDYIQTILKDDLAEVETFMQDDDLKVCGSTDGYHPATNSIMEFKTCNYNVFNWARGFGKAKKAHIAQAHWYAYMLSKKLGKKIEHIRILYFNKNQSEVPANTGTSQYRLKRVLKYMEQTAEKMGSNFEEDSTFGINISRLRESIKELEDTSQIDRSIPIDSFVYEYKQPYDEKLMQAEIEKVKKFREHYMVNNKPPNKISVKYMCNSCPYLETCRNTSYWE